jgi:hypothetical protein
VAVLRALPLIALAACYEPVLPDCTVMCSSDSDCAGGQTCIDQWCTHEGVTCSLVAPGGDAAFSEDSASPTDAPALPDGSQGGILRVKIAEQGVVYVPGQAPCDSFTAPGDECMYTVLLGAPVTLEADPHDGRYFERWEQACQGQVGTTCTITPIVWETKVEARFHKYD